ncbi:AraC family transcriptional regulator [Lutispora saccharofermentans]|uniref:AraC family transcriptional regulator n=1 Tax=Lutispora saccharofermentans TaxID=3024236 RepID=A0ABT1NEH0_9FIRM|nr:AraC family transcriptional regulator [Lutispora saccharofermentans]MCQ1528573.1 AraC family transcriptional regulator [Lutispora saccharofermentans]
MTVKEAGEKWGLGIRIVTLYCVEGRIGGAVKKGNLWLIPEDAAKPEDRRRKKAPIQEEKGPAISKDIYDLYEQRKHEDSWPFQSLYENKELFVQIVKHFPYPMHICTPDGTMLLANEEYLKFAKISNPERLYKKHNILLNPNLERWGVKDFVLRAFQGETVYAYDVKVPHQEIIERLGDNKELVSGSMFHNMTALPIRDSNDQLLFIVFIFITSRYYQDREEIMKGKEYIDDHWKEEFDIDKLADIVHMSRYHYTRLFKQYTGITPYSYYQDVKFSKLKEMLCDNNLSITQVFDECGVDYNGNLAKKFKQKLGMTPSQYRAKMTQK